MFYGGMTPKRELDNRDVAEGAEGYYRWGTHGLTVGIHYVP